MSCCCSEKRVKIGVIGVGGRSKGLLGCLAAMPDVEIAAVCDLVPSRMEEGVKIVNEGQSAYTTQGYTDHRQVLARPDIAGVIIPTSWNEHIPLAIQAMKAGKYAGIEVGGAASLEQCWELVRTYEETGVPVMMLENCCYGRDELMVLNMVRQGVFGEIVHCEGGYEHDLRVLAERLDSDHQRTFHHLHRNAELYPTHELGPIAKVLDINRGNRFLTLSSTACKSRGLTLRAREKYGEDSEYAREFALGDIVTTVLKCANGETVVLSHDTSLPRPYSRGGCVRGTKGLWQELNASIYIDGVSPLDQWESVEKYREQYDHPLWKKYEKDSAEAGHGGMDYFSLRAFTESVRNRTNTPIDAYDCAAWMAVTVLSEQSISMGGSLVPFPDFTNGKWIKREPPQPHEFSLDGIFPAYFEQK